MVQGPNINLKQMFQVLWNVNKSATKFKHGLEAPPPLLICAMLRKLVLEAFSNPLSPIPVCAVHAVSVFNVYLHDNYS